MKEGDVALAALPQADQKFKNRPVIVLRELPLHRDVLVCGISTQMQHRVAQLDQIISRADPDFKQSGLLSESLIRLGFLAVLPRTRIVGSIGAVSPARYRSLLQALAGYLTANLPT
jgi:mRNA interferase MazF